MEYTKLVKMLKDDEGLVLKPYKCPTGFLTIGYGRNLEARGISVDEAEILLHNDIKNVTFQLHKSFPEWTKYPSDIRIVLICMGFQLGVGGLMNFRKMISALQKNDFQTAANEMLDSQWAKQTPKRAKKLADIVRKAK